MLPQEQERTILDGIAEVLKGYGISAVGGYRTRDNFMVFGSEGKHILVELQGNYLRAECMYVHSEGMSVLPARHFSLADPKCLERLAALIKNHE